MRTDRLAFGHVDVVLRARGLSDADVTRETGVRPDRARVNGVPLGAADRLADWLHCHPTALFGDDWTWLAGLPKVGRYGRAVEAEPGGTFCGRPLDYRAIGRAAYYGLSAA